MMCRIRSGALKHSEVTVTATSTADELDRVAEARRRHAPAALDEVPRERLGVEHVRVVEIAEFPLRPAARCRSVGRRRAAERA